MLRIRQNERINSVDFLHVSVRCVEIACVSDNRGSRVARRHINSSNILNPLTSLPPRAPNFHSTRSPSISSPSSSFSLAVRRQYRISLKSIDDKTYCTYTTAGVELDSRADRVVDNMFLIITHYTVIVTTGRLRISCLNFTTRPCIQYTHVVSIIIRETRHARI